MHNSLRSLCLAAILILAYSTSQGETITPGAHKAKTVELFKELVALNDRGVFPSEKRLGPGNPLKFMVHHATLVQLVKMGLN